VNKRNLVLVVTLLGVVAFGVALSSKVLARLTKQQTVAEDARQRLAAESAVVPPRLVQPTSGPETETLQFSGTLRPEAEVELAFKLPGRVVQVLVKRGDVVRAGQELARLNDRDIEAQAAQARAGMAAAQAQTALARDALRRSKSLAQAGAASEQQVVMAGGQSNLGDASVAQAHASAQLIESLRQETRLVAPIDGVVIRAPTAAGFFAAPGMPLFRIEKLDTLRFGGHLSDRDAARIKKGAVLTVESEAGVTVAGTLDLIVPSVDPATHRVPIEGSLDNADGKLFAGAFVQARIEARADPTLRIPASALLTGDVPAVLLLGDDGRFARRPVDVARTEKDVLLLRSGVTTTDRVVAQPGSKWREGDRMPAKTTASAH